MIPRLTRHAPAPPLYVAACAELSARGFSGDLSVTDADRTVFATDNSIYQVEPGAVAFPRSRDDLVRIAKLLDDPRFCEIVIRPRGGATGTNGQSLGHGLVVDLSRHMTRILEIDAENGWVRVEPGVVKDQLNRALKAHGLFFAPELSTSNRATIGGMISTDACGQGSCLYGKTRDHVLDLTLVLVDGTVWRSEPLDAAGLAAVKARDDRVGAIHRAVDTVVTENAALIAERFPKLNRCLTGYDIAHVRGGPSAFDLNALICGSEGTLALIAEARLRVLPIPKAGVLAALSYVDFDAALRDAQTLSAFGAASIETIDSKVLDLARNDPVWVEVRAFFPDDPCGRAVAGINLVEFVGDDAGAVEAALARLTGMLDGAHHPKRLGYAVARGADVGRIWGMRKKAVGLLGAAQGDARPIPFVEDTAVPPEKLADFIAEFRALLDGHGLQYGMFGHVDAGVLHVRPAIDLKDPAQEPLIRTVTEGVVALTRKYGGLLWGEHGKGFRSEFVPAVFGPLMPALEAVKRAFDPDDRLNPGKIASAGGTPLTRIDGVPRRGERDRAIPAPVRAGFDEALHCNGNGACFSFDTDEAMCPSWKATRERRHSPKGRASLMREWLTLLAAEGVDPSGVARRRSALRDVLATLTAGLRRRARGDDFSHAVKEAMDGCLACKSCTGQCPIKVDVPTFRAKFLDLYHTRYPRPLKDHLVGALERALPLAARMPALSNGLLGNALAQAVLRRAGLVGIPQLSRPGLTRALAGLGVSIATPEALSALSKAERARSVVVVQDAFTSYFEAPVVADLCALIGELGFRPWLAPYRPNGKPLQVHGFLARFAGVARRNVAMLRRLEATGVPLIGIDPSMTLTYRAEYPKALPGTALPRVHLVQEWLAAQLGRIAPRGPGVPRQLLPLRLLPHCSERTNAPGAVKDWQTVFDHLGLRLDVVPAGCCGMAGTYGHETRHRATSEVIYGQSWARHVAQAPEGTLLATGYSCRCQAGLVDGRDLPHPVQALLAHIRATPALPTVERAA